jgi:hypothetical protein
LRGETVALGKPQPGRDRAGERGRQQSSVSLVEPVVNGLSEAGIGCKAPKD